MSTYTIAEYIAALRYFGYKKSRAEIIAYRCQAEGTLYGLNHLVREYKSHI